MLNYELFILCLQQNSSPSTQNGGQNPSNIMSCLFGATGFGIFIFWDILFWIVFNSLTVYFLSITPFPAFSHSLPGCIPTIYITLCWFSVIFETVATIMKHKILMIAVCVLTAILSGLSVLSTSGIIDIWSYDNYIYICGFHVTLFASIWNFARFVFQIKVIQWIRSSNGHPIQTSTQNGGQNLSTIATCFTSNSIFIFLNILFWIAFTSVALYFLSEMPYPPYDQGYNCPPILIYLAICWFSVLFETFSTIREHKNGMIAVCVLTAILLGFSIYMSPLLSTNRSIWMNYEDFVGFELALFASIWNFVRFVFQINVIQWIRRTNGHSIHTEETDYIPLLPQTVNGYQSI